MDSFQYEPIIKRRDIDVLELLNSEFISSIILNDDFDNFEMLFECWEKIYKFNIHDVYEVVKKVRLFLPNNDLTDIVKYLMCKDPVVFSYMYEDFNKGVINQVQMEEVMCYAFSGIMDNHEYQIINTIINCVKCKNYPNILDTIPIFIIEETRKLLEADHGSNLSELLNELNIYYMEEVD